MLVELPDLLRDLVPVLFDDEWIVPRRLVEMPPRKAPRSDMDVS